MGEGSSNVTGVEVEGLHSTGRTIAGRAGGGRAAASGIATGLDGASDSVGHHVVMKAVSDFVTSHVLHDSGLLGNQLESGGDNVSNVSAIARSSDEEAAADLQTAITPNTHLSDRINGQL